MEGCGWELAIGEFSENSIEEARNVLEEIEQQLERGLGLHKFVCSHLPFLSTSLFSLYLSLILVMFEGKWMSFFNVKNEKAL